MLIGRGSHACFRAWSNNTAFGNKEFDDAEKCADERAKAMFIIKNVPRPVLPPMVMPWPAKRTIAMMRMDMTLEHAIVHRILKDDVLQYVIYCVTDLLLMLSDLHMLMMDVHGGNVLLKFASGAYTGFPRVYLNDPGFFHFFGNDGTTMPPHVRHSGEFDPAYDLAFFTYSVLGLLRRLKYTRIPIMPLSERDLVPYQRYIGPPHHWDMAVGRFAYQPELVAEIERSAATHERRALKRAHGVDVVRGAK